MALIKCPECGKDVSDLSKQCIHCGYPLQANKSTQSAPVMNTRTTPQHQTTPPKTEDKSGEWGTTMKIWICIFGAFGGFFYFLMNESFFLGLLCLIGFPILAFMSFNKGPESLKKGVAEEIKKEEEHRMNGGYKCPQCGKNAGHPISAVSKGVSVGAMGLASNKIGKTYKCENCDYMW